MSLLRSGINQSQWSLALLAFGGVTQIRTATKKVSGSKTNKNDSAGRRLGPKAYEDHFVQPGQIIMRQRGTKIHPGENVDIGKDHTIYAKEPGFVKFYMDPFHPLRKFVGVALKRDILLPLEHFAPRLRRFGYVEITGEDAEREEKHMSRKEYLAQPELESAAAKEEELRLQTLQSYAAELSGLGVASDVDAAAQRLYEVSQLMVVGQLLEQAQQQVTFNHVHALTLAARKGADVSTKEYIAFAEKLDSAVSVDFAGKIYRAETPEAAAARKATVAAELESFSGKVLSSADKTEVLARIAEPGVFSKKERTHLRHKHFPKVLPTSVPGTVVEVKDGKKAPKNTVAVRTLDPSTRTVHTVIRTKDAFA